jgi:holo-[acyl-carrier protein] synthase
VIVGLGAGVVEVARIEAVLARHGERFLGRVFTAGERAYAGRRVESLAARFAAKLAGKRALGLRFARWQDLEVVREPGRAPELRLHGGARERARRLAVGRAALTLAHDAGLGLGQVILETEA